jgi:hypothetical protein
VSGVDAYFLWIGSDLPPYARLAVTSACVQGFRVTCFVDRPVRAGPPADGFTDYGEAYDEWRPEQIVHDGRSPAYEAFSDVFRLKLLADRGGWWFDCDVVLLRPAEDFARLVGDARFAAARAPEAPKVGNGVMYQAGSGVPAALLERARALLPVVRGWTTLGTSLLTERAAADPAGFRVLDCSAFYPLHHDDFAQALLPSRREALEAAAAGSHAVSLWGSQLRKSGLSLIPPPPGSYYDHLMQRYGLGPQDRFDETSLLTLMCSFHELRRVRKELEAARARTLSRRIRRAMRPGLRLVRRLAHDGPSSGGPGGI